MVVVIHKGKCFGAGLSEPDLCDMITLEISKGMVNMISGMFSKFKD